MEASSSSSLSSAIALPSLNRLHVLQLRAVGCRVFFDPGLIVVVILVAHAPPPIFLSSYLIVDCFFKTTLTDKFWPISSVSSASAIPASTPSSKTSSSPAP